MRIPVLIEFHGGPQCEIRVSLTRVPCVGELIRVDGSIYTVKKVIHETDYKIRQEAVVYV